MPRPRSPGLTPREQEVFDLLRQGLTNPQIAERLGISLDGAKYHVSQILMKLDVSTRVEAVAWAPDRRVFGLAGIGAALKEASVGGALKTATIGVLAVAVVLVALIVIGVMVGRTRPGGEERAVATPELPPASADEPPSFLALLEYIPARENSALYYTDYAAARGILGIQPPSQDAGYGEMVDYWGSLGQIGLYQNPIAAAFASSTQELNSELGFSFANLDQSLYVGQHLGGSPCSVSHVIAGRFDEARIENTLKGTSSSPDALTRDVHNGVPYYSLPVACSISDSFGGPGSLVAGMDLVFWNGEPGAEVEAMIDAGASTLPPLAGTRAYQSLAQSFAELGVFSAYTQVHEDETWLEHRLERAFDDYGQDSVEAAGYLKPYIGLAIGTGHDSEGTYGVLIFLHETADDASANATVLQEKVDTGTSYVTGRPWSDTITRSEIEVDGTVVQAKLWSNDPTLLKLAYDNLDSLFVSRP